MKYLILLCLFVSTSSFAISHKEFLELPSDEQRKEVIKAYRVFVRDYSEAHKVSAHEGFRLPDLIEAALAADYDCLYGGWPAKRVRGICPYPSNRSCGEGKIQCQPLLYGSGVCVNSATRDDRSRVSKSCEAKFNSMQGNLSHVLNYISDKSHEADEFFRLVDEICRIPAEARSFRCITLKARIQEMKTQSPQRALVVATTAAGTVNETVQGLNSRVRCESCETQRAQTVDEPERRRVIGPMPVESEPTTGFPRVVSGYHLASCGGQNGYTDGFGTLRVFDCHNRDDQGVFSGFSFRQDPQTHPLIRGLRTPYPDSRGTPSRFWNSVSVNSSFNETYLIIEESAGGPDSHNVKSYMFVIPRVTVPSTRIEGNNIVTTLATGETVTMDKSSRAITGGALTEGPLDMNTNRHARKPPNIHYSGSGISIRLNHRYEHPLTSSETAEVKQGSRTCNLPRTAILDAEGKMKQTSDADLLAVINRTCRGGGFTLP